MSNPDKMMEEVVSLIESHIKLAEQTGYENGHEAGYAIGLEDGHDKAEEKAKIELSSILKAVDDLLGIELNELMDDICQAKDCKFAKGTKTNCEALACPIFALTSLRVTWEDIKGEHDVKTT
jgi:hypothetical protein